MKLLKVIFPLFLSVALRAQQITSSEIIAMSNDTAKVEALLEYCKDISEQNMDSAKYYLSKAELLSTKINYHRGLVGVMLVKGTLAWHEGDFITAKTLLMEADREASKNNYTNLIAANKLLLGNVYARTGDYENALLTYRQGLAICETTGNYTTASSLYISIGITKRLSGELDSAEYYYRHVLKIQEEQLHDSLAMASIYNNIGSLYFYQGEYITTEKYVLKALEINRLSGNRRYEMINLANLGGVWGNPDGNLTKAMQYFNQALQIAEERNAKSDIYEFYKNMAEINANFHQYKQAYEYLLLSNQYRDSVYSESQKAQLVELDKKYQTEKIQDSLHMNQQELDITLARESEAEAKASRKAWQLAASLLLTALTLGLLIYVYRNSKKQKQMNNLLLEKNEEINLQKIIIEEKNIELTDSITYAKRIQSALLPSQNKLNDVLGNHFIFFRPKDIVSGDFYFVYKSGEKKYFSVADCTGHGVPGAMVSMLGYESLSKIVAVHNLNAAEILEQLNATLIEALSNKDSLHDDIKDGMDISFCILEKYSLSFCGANNGAYIIRKSDAETEKKIT
ncbi:MAG: tetratricopeptide repeat protein [Crocinitomicaceae bacterium]|nr:tetratricopeptide repeat protein [Crocinitomicaceae bacterium]